MNTFFKTFFFFCRLIRKHNYLICIRARLYLNKMSKKWKGLNIFWMICTCLKMSKHGVGTNSYGSLRLIIITLRSQNIPMVPNSRLLLWWFRNLHTKDNLIYGDQSNWWYCTCLLPKVSWDWLQHPFNSRGVSGTDNGWII